MADSALPQGWDIVSLHYADPGKDALVSAHPTNRQIENADAIRVSYTPPDKDEPIAYRMIHGAVDREQIGDLIDHVVKVTSPV